MSSPQEREAEIRERLENVSSAPWLPSPEKGGLYPDEIHGGENGEYRIARFYSNPRRDLPFVIAARSDVPYLLARLAQLTQALEQILEDTDEDPATRLFVKHILATMPLGV